LTINKLPSEYRERWGTENYRADMDFSLCRQTEPTDKFGTPEDIRNACFYGWDVLINNPNNALFSTSISLLVWCQKGLSKKKFPSVIEAISVPKNIEIGNDQNIANAVHHNLDWLRACLKRTWDGRPINPMKQMLEASIKGQVVNKYNALHYDEKEDRY